MIPLTITEIVPSFIKQEFREVIDKRSLLLLIKKYKNNPSICEPLKKIKKKMKKNNYIKITHSRKVNYGRLIPNGGYIYLEKKIRNTLANDKYVDIDIVNCWSVILSQVCAKNNLMCEKLMSYVNNREFVLNGIIEEEKCDREEAKNKIHKCIMTDNYNTTNTFLKELCNDTTKIVDIILLANGALKKTLKAYNKKANKTSNLKYSLLTYFLGHYELLIIESLFKQLKSLKLIDDNNFATYSYDGIMIKNKREEINKHLEKIQKGILKDTSFNIKLKIKSMSDKIKFTNIDQKSAEVKKQLDILFNTYCVNNFITDLETRKDFLPGFFEELGELNYPNNKLYMEHYFDHHFIFVLKGGVYTKKTIEYIYENKTKFPGKFYTKINLEEYSEKGLKEFVYKDDNDDDKIFIKEHKSAKYNKIIFDPTNNNYANYNLFEGFGYKMIDCEISKDDEILFKVFLYYIKKYFCDDNQKMFDNFMSFLANIIQFPDVKVHQSYILYSNVKGVGKSKLGVNLRKVFGLNHTFFGDVNKILGNGFDECIEHKLMIFIDEYKSGSGAGSDKFQELKSKISADRTFINKKFKSVEEHKDYCRYIIATDSTKFVKLERNHRRFNILHVKKIDEPGLLKKINLINGNKSLTIAKLFGEYLEKFNIKYDSYNAEEWSNNRVQPACHDDFLTTSSFDDFCVCIYQKNYELENDSEEIKMYKKEWLIRFRDDYLYKIYESITGKYKMKKTNFYKELRKKEYYWTETKNPQNKLHFKIDMKNLHKYLFANRLLQGNDDKEYKNFWIVKEEEEDSDSDEDEEEQKEEFDFSPHIFLGRICYNLPKSIIKLDYNGKLQFLRHHELYNGENVEFIDNYSRVVIEKKFTIDE